MHNDFIKTDNKEKQGGLDILKIRAAAWDKVITSNGFNIHDLQDMYLDFLSKCSIEISGNVTRFEKDLLKKATKYEIIKDQESGVFRKESASELFSIFSSSISIYLSFCHQKAVLNLSEQLFSQLERTYLNESTCLMVT